MTGTATVQGILRTGDHSSRPAANAVSSGTLYSCTTHSLVYQSDGSSWSTWATLGSAGSSLTVEEVDASPTDSAVTKIVFPNGTLGIASHVATYTPAAATFSGVRCHLTSGQSIPDSSWTPLAFGASSEDFDVGSWHDTSSNTSRMTVPSGVSYVRVAAASGFDTGGGGMRYIAIAKNGTRIYNVPHDAAGTVNGAPALIATDVVAVAATDYIEVHVYQDSGGAKNAIAQSYISVQAIG